MRFKFYSFLCVSRTTKFNYEISEVSSSWSSASLQTNGQQAWQRNAKRCSVTPSETIK
jgi:hypothetical protein